MNPRFLCGKAMTFSARLRIHAAFCGIKSYSGKSAPLSISHN
jgi:hypothetical protein